MSLTEWLRAANSLGKNLSRQKLIKKLGQPPGRITGNGKGGWKKRTGDKKGQRQRRASFDTTSTPVAAYEAKKLDQTSKRISDEASMFGLEPTQIEHILDQSDSKFITEGAAGDPSNKLTVPQSAARFKDKVKLAVDDSFAVTINPTENSIKIVPVQFFDPIVDPAELPGIDIRTQEDLDRFTNRSGSTQLQGPSVPQHLAHIPGMINRITHPGSYTQSSKLSMSALDKVNRSITQAVHSSPLGLGLTNVVDIINGDDNVFTKATKIAEQIAPPTVATAATVFNQVNQYVADNNGGEDIFDSIPNGSAEERKAKNKKVNAEHVENNGHTGNEFGDYISNTINDAARRLNGQ